MNYTEIAIIGLILAVDATVYSFSYGLILRERRFSSALWLALTVGLYQAIMPLLGYMAGSVVRELVAAWDHWIVLAVFSWLGCSVIHQAWTGEEDEAKSTPMGFTALMLIGIATSIDALAIGACMALGDIGGTSLTIQQLLIAVSIIGVITFVCSESAFHLARPFHRLPTRWLATASGLLLIGLGVRNLLEHLMGC